MSIDVLICDALEKAQRENDNAVEQLKYIDRVVREYGERTLNVGHIVDLHRLAVGGIYSCAGEFRNARRKIEIGHFAPHESRVRDLVSDCVDWANRETPHRDGIEIAGYILWRLSWIHPFAGGNGRTARAAAYLYLCMRVGFMIPGPRPLPAWICDERAGYIDALRAADRSITDADGNPDDSLTPDLLVMTDFLRTLVANQVRPVLDFRQFAEPLVILFMSSPTFIAEMVKVAKKSATE